MQTLSVLVARDPAVLQHGFTGVDPLMMPLNVTSVAKSSRLFSSFSEQVQTWLETEPVTTNLHHDGVPPINFEDNDNLKSIFNVLSTNTDATGRDFVSTMEGKTIPIYGVQWHPERPQFEWSKVDPSTGKDPINHDMHAIITNQAFANFFTSEVCVADAY